VLTYNADQMQAYALEAVAAAEERRQREGTKMNEQLREMVDEGSVIISSWVHQGDVTSYRVTARGRDGWRKTADGKTLEEAVAKANALDWLSPGSLHPVE
jgi:hypothetical protein